MASTILITASGSMASECVIESLKKLGHNLISTDIYPNEWVGVEKHFDKLYMVPLFNEPAYTQTLLDICKRHNVEYIFPLTDNEIDTLNVERDIFVKNNIKLCICHEKSITIARNKLLIKDIPLTTASTIKTVSASHINSLNTHEKIIAKLAHGRSSKGQYIFNTSKDIPDHMDNDYIFQNFIEGDIYVVDYVRDIFGNDFCLSRKEILRTQHGAGISVYVHKNQIIEQAAKEIGNYLNIQGCINIEFIFDGKNYYLMDINPRFSAGIAFSHLSGIDFVANHLKCFQDKSIEIPQNYKNNYHATKRYITFCTEK